MLRNEAIPVVNAFALEHQFIIEVKESFANNNKLKSSLQSCLRRCKARGTLKRLFTKRCYTKTLPHALSVKDIKLEVRLKQGLWKTLN